MGRLGDEVERGGEDYRDEEECQDEGECQDEEECHDEEDCQYQSVPGWGIDWFVSMIFPASVQCPAVDISAFVLLLGPQSPSLLT